MWFTFVLIVSIVSIVAQKLSFSVNRLIKQIACLKDVIREVKHDVYGRRQTAKITSDFLFFSCNP